jgi:hypothetical protein
MRICAKEGRSEGVSLRHATIVSVNVSGTDSGRRGNASCSSNAPPGSPAQHTPSDSHRAALPPSPLASPRSPAFLQHSARCSAAPSTHNACSACRRAAYRCCCSAASHTMHAGDTHAAHAEHWGEQPSRQQHHRCFGAPKGGICVQADWPRHWPAIGRMPCFPAAGQHVTACPSAHTVCSRQSVLEGASTPDKHRAALHELPHDDAKRKHVGQRMQVL